MCQGHWPYPWGKSIMVSFPNKSLAYTRDSKGMGHKLGQGEGRGGEGMGEAPDGGSLKGHKGIGCFPLPLDASGQAVKPGQWQL